MEERFTEIRFYYFMQKLMATFKYSAVILDIVEAYCNVGHVDSFFIKKLISQIRSGAGPIVSYPEEICYLARQLNYSYRDVYKIAGVALSTQNRIKHYMVTHEEQYQGITKHLKDSEYAEVEKFMRVVDIMKGMTV